MKDMMLPARNFSTVLLCALLLLVAGCKRDSSNEPETLNGSVSSPAWSAPADYDYTSSMTAVVLADLKLQYPEAAADFAINENDLLGAFDGEKCLGVASPNEGLFHLMVIATEGSFTLRYYSAQYKNLFVSEPIPFLTDSRLGTPDHPYSPKLVIGD